MTEDEAPAALAVQELTAAGQTLSVAESLTGGLVAAELTSVPGASAAFAGSVTAYATGLKHRLLRVDAGLLAGRGPVDAEVARRMAVGVRELLGTDWGLATTGVAGPEPQGGHPVGTVHVAVAGPQGPPVALRLTLDGGRAEIRERSVRAVLRLLCRELAANARRTCGNTPEGLDVCSPE